MADGIFTAMKSFRSAAFLILFAAPMGACGRDLKSAEGVAQEFVDQHYVNIDLARAREYSVGLARDKIDDEIRLTRGQAIDASTRKPNVRYELVEKKQEGEGRISFFYKGTIQAEDAPEFTRRWLVVARKEGDGWRVSNFSEYD
ncbi:MAG TPA: hypothetical protein VL754_21415 [Verrucomicrobiae bacterium]|nr:hypothetical protein [Verrucomicrobiae bacterium]